MPKNQRQFHYFPHCISFSKRPVLPFPRVFLPAPFSFALPAFCAVSNFGLLPGRSLSSCPSELKRALRLIPELAPFIPITVRGDRVATMDIACCSPRSSALWLFQWCGFGSKACRVGFVSQYGGAPAHSMRIYREYVSGLVKSDCACGRVRLVVMMLFRGGREGGGSCRLTDW